MGTISGVIFDLDGTLVRYRGIEFESSWGALAAAAGVHEASRSLLEEYLPRRDAYAEWVEKDVALLAGIAVSQVERDLFPAPYADGVRQAIEALRGTFRLGILSSGVDLVAEWVRQDLGLDFALANRVEVLDGHFTGRGAAVVDLWSKGQALRALCAEHGLRPAEICYVGDHVNDIPALREAALAVAANPKDRSVVDASDHVISDFSALPALIEAFAGGGAA